MKVKIIDKFAYQTWPEVEGMIEIKDEDIAQIGITKCFDIENQKVIPYDNSEALQEQVRIDEIHEMKVRLRQLSDDIIQDQAGEFVPDIKKKKIEFIKLHNELRQLEGKQPRILK